jgi:hypothetical protein
MAKKSPHESQCEAILEIRVVMWSISVHAVIKV